MQTKEIVLAIGVFAARALAAAFAGIRRWLRIPAASRRMMRERDDAGCAGDSAKAATSDLNQLLRHTLRRDLSLASEHVHSIRCLLEIAREHRQPIPSAALTNLELVSKHLGELQRRIDNGDDETAPQPKISAFAHRPELQSRPRPRRPSFGYHVSPSDISTPCD